MSDNDPTIVGENKSFWKTLPGILTAIAGILTPIAAILALIFSPSPTTDSAPQIHEFISIPTEIDPGDEAKLKWEIEKASIDSEIAIDNGIGDVPLSGMISVKPKKSTIYTLEVKNSKGSDSKIAEIKVKEEPPHIAPVVRNDPPVVLSLTSDRDSPQKVGASITFTAIAEDDNNDPLSYKFFLNGRAMTGWSNENSWTWTAEAEEAGVNQIEVRIRDGLHAGSNSYDDNRNVNFKITVPPFASMDVESLFSTIPSVKESTTPSARIDNVYIEHDFWQGNVLGMVIHTKFSIDNFVDKSGSVEAYFSFSNNNVALRDFDGLYKAPDGQVSVGESFTPRYTNTVFYDFRLFIPYSQLHMSPNEQNGLTARVVIWDNSDYPHISLAESSVNFVFKS